MAYYKQLNGICYDRSLLDAAEAFTRGRGEWRKSLEKFRSCTKWCSTTGFLQNTNPCPCGYITQHFALTEPVQKWF